MLHKLMGEVLQLAGHNATTALVAGHSTLAQARAKLARMNTFWTKDIHLLIHQTANLATSQQHFCQPFALLKLRANLARYSNSHRSRLHGSRPSSPTSAHTPLEPTKLPSKVARPCLAVHRHQQPCHARAPRACAFAPIASYSPVHAADSANPMRFACRVLRSD